MSYLTLPITVPLTIFAVLFAVSNMEDVSVSLWPLENSWTLPLYLLGLGMLGGGFLLGALFVWILSQRTAFRYWRQKRETKKLARELGAARAAPAPPDGIGPRVGEEPTPLLAGKAKP